MSVFPARAGMSPAGGRQWLHHISVPRASGDEPRSVRGLQLAIACSPRERG